MPSKRSRRPKRPKAPAQLAKLVVEVATGKVPNDKDEVLGQPTEPEPPSKPAAISSLGRVILGGVSGSQGRMPGPGSRYDAAE